MYHKDFPFGKGVWIWRLSLCLNGDINAIIKKCKDYDISYLIIKSGDGANVWTQLTPDIVNRFHYAGIKVYSWTYNYGDEPLKEAEVATKSLGLGVDGHVFDAEGEYERLQGNAQAAETMLKAVRAKYPGAFLAHAPFCVIDFHQSFPYMTFGKYCDAVMPQIYHGTMKQTPQEAFVRTYDNFRRWHENWKNSGHADSIKPIIPIGQTYDNYNITPAYVLTPADILSFVKTAKLYKSVNFWSWQHILRDDCWEAIRNSDLDKPTDADRGIVAQEKPVETPQVATVPSEPAQSEQPTQTIEPPSTTTTIVEEVISIETPATPPAEEIPPVEQPAKQEEPIPEPAAPETPAVTLPPLKQTFDIPKDKPTTIVLTPNDKHPDGMEVKVITHKTHRQYFIELVKYVIALLQTKNFLRRK